MKKVALALVLLVAIGVAQRLIPDADRIYRPIASHGELRQDVAALPYTLRVDGVEIGRTLTIDDERKTTQGVWVVLRATATATKEQARLGNVALVTRSGAQYGVTDRLLGFDAANLDPGIPQSGTLAFELPKGQVEGAVLRVTNARYASIHQLNGALGPAVEIDLALTGSQLAAAAETVTVERTRL